MRHLFVLNPAAGKSDSTSALKDEISQVMASRRDDYLIRVTERPLHAAEIVTEEAQKGGELRIYACGGDGTINEVLQGAVGFSNCIIAPCPCGSGNDFVKVFGENAARFRSINELVNGEVMSFDLIQCEDRYSINICSVGFDARVARDVHKFSGLPGVSPYGAFTIAAVRNLINSLSGNYKVEIDGTDYSGRYTLLVAANARFYGGGYNPVPDADPTDGLLDFLLVKKVSRLAFPMLIRKYSDGRWTEMPKYCSRIKGKTMQIECLDTPSEINLDGEVFETRPLVIRLSDRRMRILGPIGSFAEWKTSKIEEFGARASI